MHKLNQQATTIFCRILNKLGNNVSIKIIMPDYMPLSLERIGKNIITPLGAATAYSLAHTYVQNGDLMRDPEMCFFVIDKRSHPKECQMLNVYPQMYQLDSLGIYEESISIEGGAFIVKKKWQRSHCNFANQWMINIRAQRFLTSKLMIKN